VVVAKTDGSSEDRGDAKRSEEGGDREGTAEGTCAGVVPAEALAWALARAETDCAAVALPRVLALAMAPRELLGAPCTCARLPLDDLVGDCVGAADAQVLPVAHADPETSAFAELEALAHAPSRSSSNVPLDALVNGELDSEGHVVEEALEEDDCDEEALGDDEGLATEDCGMLADADRVAATLRLRRSVGATATTVDVTKPVALGDAHEDSVTLEAALAEFFPR